jgi:hypothetical protein
VIAAPVREKLATPVVVMECNAVAATLANGR